MFADGAPLEMEIGFYPEVTDNPELKDFMLRLPWAVPVASPTEPVSAGEEGQQLEYSFGLLGISDGEDYFALTPYDAGRTVLEHGAFTPGRGAGGVIGLIEAGNIVNGDRHVEFRAHFDPEARFTFDASNIERVASVLAAGHYFLDDLRTGGVLLSFHAPLVDFDKNLERLRQRGMPEPQLERKVDILGKSLVLHAVPRIGRETAESAERLVEAGVKRIEPTALHHSGDGGLSPAGVLAMLERGLEGESTPSLQG